jgi:hypothetical protein
MTDLWGDIPYSEFNVAGLTAPHPDNSADIYNALIALLESGSADLNNTEVANALKPGSDDFFYAGNAAKWSRLNNTIRLKLLLQSRKAKAEITEWQTKFNALTAANDFIASGEDFQFWFNEKTSPVDQRHPAYFDEYDGGQITYYISPFFYEIMKGQTYNYVGNPFSGIADPRVPYYFYNQLRSGQETQNNYEYRNGEFVSIFFATNGPNSASSNDASVTRIGLYLCGGKYDDGAGGKISYDVGNGAAPHKMVTFYALKFMLAELALAGETSGDARTLFSEALTAAIAHVNTVVAKQTGVPAISTTARNDFITAVLAKYDAANDAGKMQIIITQKWIANVFNPVDSYTDYRRTGYPVLFDPANTSDSGYGVNPTVAANSPDRVPINIIASFPRSLYYPTNSETDLNPNLTQKTNLASPLLFWDK